MGELQRTPSKARSPQGISNSVLQLFRNALQIRQEDELIDLLQIGKTLYTDVPRQMRTELWLSVLQVKKVGLIAAKNYRLMLAKPLPEEVSGDIEKDVGRTFPAIPRFAREEGKQQLQRVLRAAAAYDPEVNYCQGMNFVAALLLMWLPREADAFGVLAVLLHERGMRDLFKVDMSMLQVRLWQVGQLLPAELAAHLEAHGTAPVLYASSWLLTAFAADFPLYFSSRVMDVILTDRYLDAIMKVVVGIVRDCGPELMVMRDMEAMVDLLRCGVAAWPRERLQDTLTRALATAWTPAQAAVLRQRATPKNAAEAVLCCGHVALPGGPLFQAVGRFGEAPCERPALLLQARGAPREVRARPVQARLPLRPAQSLAGDGRLPAESSPSAATGATPRLHSAQSVASSLSQRALPVETRALSFAWAQNLPAPQVLEPAPRRQRLSRRSSSASTSLSVHLDAAGTPSGHRLHRAAAPSEQEVSSRGGSDTQPSSPACTTSWSGFTAVQEDLASIGSQPKATTAQEGANDEARWSALEFCSAPLSSQHEEAWSAFADFECAQPASPPCAHTGPSTPNRPASPHARRVASPSPTPDFLSSSAGSSPALVPAGRLVQPPLEDSQANKAGASQQEAPEPTAQQPPDLAVCFPALLPTLSCERPMAATDNPTALPRGGAAAALGRSTSLFSGLVGDALEPHAAPRAYSLRRQAASTGARVSEAALLPLNRTVEEPASMHCRRTELDRGVAILPSERAALQLEGPRCRPGAEAAGSAQHSADLGALSQSAAPLAPDWRSVPGHRCQPPSRSPAALNAAVHSGWMAAGCDGSQDLRRWELEQLSDFENLDRGSQILIQTHT